MSKYIKYQGQVYERVDSKTPSKIKVNGVVYERVDSEEQKLKQAFEIEIDAVLKNSHYWHEQMN